MSIKSKAAWVVGITALLLILGGCGGDGGGGGDTLPLFPTVEDVLVAGWGTATLEVYPGIEIEVVERQVIAKFVGTADRTDYDNLVGFLADRNSAVVGQIPDLLTVQVQVPTNADILTVAADVTGLQYIEDASYNQILYDTVLTFDSSPASFSGANMWKNHVRAPQAWKLCVLSAGNVGDASVGVGVVDEGVDASNAQFQKNTILRVGGVDTAVLRNHGVAVAALAAAHGDDEVENGSSANNMAGVAWNCKILSYDASSFGKSSALDVTVGVKTCIENGARVVNVSQGYNQGDLPILLGWNWGWLLCCWE